MSQTQQTIGRSILPKLTVPRSQAQEKFNLLLQKAQELKQQSITSKEDLKVVIAEANKWHDYVDGTLLTFFNNPLFASEFLSRTRKYFTSEKWHITKELELFRNHMNRCINNLESIVERLDLIQEPFIINSASQSNQVKNIQVEALAKIEIIAQRFHLTARQLLQRRRDHNVPRDTLKINDEYDVQDLFHTLLRLFFDDIRDEEWTPSYAGGHSRIDFLLKEEQIAIEIKMTRAGLRAKELSDQLIIDITRYRSAHPDCKMLVAFVYDPDGFINNPRGVERDLSKETNGMQITVIINPS